VHVVIMGCGRVGSTLARSLEERNHTVSVIDSEPDSFRRLGPGFNGDKVTGYGFDQEVLEKAGIRRADAFAAVSSGDNSNIIATKNSARPMRAVALSLKLNAEPIASTPEEIDTATVSV
jgi:trk system potassium uptake protein TrkA